MNSSERNELEEQLSDARDRAHAWKALMEHPSFERFTEELRQQNDIAKSVIMSSPLNPESNVYAQEFFKGEFAGVEKALEFPRNQYEAAQREVTLLTVQLENFDESEIALRPPRSRVDTDDNFGG